jgi:DNA-binding PadR family transcriptional regulator
MSTSREDLLSEFDECPCTGATLNKLIQPAILTVLADEELHGYRIAQRIADMPMFHGEQPDASGIYRFLRAMEERDLVLASWDVSDRGPAKRLYKMTAAGRRCLSRWVETLESHREAIGTLLVLARRATGGGEKRRGARRAKGRSK